MNNIAIMDAKKRGMAPIDFHIKHPHHIILKLHPALSKNDISLSTMYIDNVISSTGVSSKCFAGRVYTSDRLVHPHSGCMLESTDLQAQHYGKCQHIVDASLMSKC